MAQVFPPALLSLTKKVQTTRKHIFMVDASKGFLKDGNKNRLREQDIHKIVDVFNKQIEVPKFSRLVSIKEIKDEKNDFNLNIPRYIDSQEEEDIQDIEAHLLGDIPKADIDALNEYWEVYKTLRTKLFSTSKRKNYLQLKVIKDTIKQTIFNHPEFVSFSKEMDELFTEWKTRNTKLLKGLSIGIKPKQTIFKISEDILKTYTGKALMDKYDMYQHLMNYWNEVMQDDCYLVAVDGWKAELSIIKETKSATVWDCDLVPKTLVIDRYYLKEKKTIEKLEADKEALVTQITELEEEHSGEDGYFADVDKVNKANVQKRLKELATPKPKSKKKKEEYLMAAEPEVAYGILGEAAVLEQYLKLLDDQTEINKKMKEATADLDKKVIERYKTLTETEIKHLVVDDKWMSTIERSVKTEMERISQRLTQRIKELAERYETPLPKQTNEVAEIEAKVNAHLQKMGFVWE